MTNEVFVVFLDFKSTKTREMVTVNEDGSYTIFINSRLAPNIQLQAYKHALSHIEHGDFDKDDVQQIEADAHEFRKEKMEERIRSSEFEAWLKASRKKRARIRKKLEAYSKKMDYLNEHYPELYARRIEHQYLYGDDL